MSHWPWITECARCGKVNARGMVRVCGQMGKRSPRGRWRRCQGGLFRRHDLEDSLRAAETLGGYQAGADLLIAMQHEWDGTTP